MATAFATDPQIALIKRLMTEQGMPIDTLPKYMSKQRASAAIELLIEQGKRARTTAAIAQASATTPDEALTPGMYKIDGVVYQVRPNQEKTRLYAKRLVEINTDRITEDDQIVQVEFEYERGAVFRIKPTDRMGLEEGKALCIRYGKCICCGRVLKAAKSVERGIGPVCIKYFAA